MDALARKVAAAIIQMKGASIGSIDSETIPALTGGKKNPMKGKVTKVAKKQNVMFFCNSNNNSYNDMVKRRLVKEGKNPETFVLGKRPWGTRLPDTPFIEHKGNLYVEVIFLQSPKDVVYFLDGAPIAKSDIQGLPVDKPSTGQGGLDDKVVLRTFKLSSIKALKMGELSVI